VKHRLLSFFAVIATGATAQASVAPPPPTAAEVHPGMVVEPLVLTVADGTRLRAVVTKPQGAQGRLPAILFVPWLSCSTVAIPRENLDGWSVMLQRLVRESGAVVWRTDKRGVGGSDGDCAALDYETELADQRASLDALRRRPDVDPRRIVIFGGSMGSNMAPLLAADSDVAGVAVWGGGARTWAERIMAFERNRIELRGTPVEARAAAMTARHRFVDRFLIGGASPQAIAAADPALGAVWRDFAGARDTTLYGRPFAFHLQAQRRNWAAAWDRVRAPVLATLGENDWFEDAAGVALIGDVVNRDSPGRARVLIIPGLDHHFSRYSDRRAAFREEGGVVDVEPVMRELLPWLRARFSE